MPKFKGVVVSKQTAAKFWDKVRISGPEDCWEWQAGLNSKKKGFDYGLFWLPGVGSVLSHRLALTLSTKVYSDLDVLHTCDNPKCCNPKHLLFGTHQENMEDCSKKGRKNPLVGVQQPKAKLDDNKVRKIRKLSALREKYCKYTDSYFANKYGVHKSLVRAVIKNKVWKHV